MTRRSRVSPVRSRFQHAEKIRLRHDERSVILPAAALQRCGIRVAAFGAIREFVELDSRNHILLEHEPAWREFREALLEFTGVGGAVTDEGLDPRLTARERGILRLLCEGHSNAHIAWVLGVAEKTVRNHVSSVFRKLGVRSRAEAIVLAHRRAEAPQA